MKKKHPLDIDHAELTDKHIRLRKIGFFLALAVAVGAFAVGIINALHVEHGWSEIRADDGSGLNCAGDFTLQIELGAASGDAAAERRLAIQVYTRAAVKAWQLFTPDMEIADMVNICWLNRHPNQTFEVDPVLYQALQSSSEAGRWLYLGPLYEMADSLIASQNDLETLDFDPREDGDAALMLQTILPFVQDPDAITLECLPDNHVCLHVSEEYLTEAEAWGIQRLIDFSWQKNAWIADYIASSLEEAEFTAYTLASRDGYVRSGPGEYRQTVYGWKDAQSFLLTDVLYQGACAMLTLRRFPLGAPQEDGYYIRQDHAIRSRFLSVADGLDHPASDAAVLYRKGAGCAELLMTALPFWIEGKSWDGMDENDHETELLVIQENSIEPVSVRTLKWEVPGML